MAIESTIPECCDQNYEFTQSTVQPLSDPAHAKPQRFSTAVAFGCVTFWQAGNRDAHVGDRKVSAIDNGQPSDILSVQHHPATTSSQ